MKIGTVYRYNSDLVVQLTEKNLEGYALFLDIGFSSSGSWNSGQPLFAKSNGITNQRKANEYVEQNNFVEFRIIKLNAKLEAEPQSTYEEPSKMELGVGDKFLEIGKTPEYTVLGFFQREVVKDIANPKSPMVKRHFPYAINLEPLLDYIGKITNSREGLMSIADQSNANVTISDVEQQNLKAIFFANTRYPYWSIDAPRVSNVIYLKQPKPLPTIDFKLDFNAVTRGLSPEEYDEYRLLLGEDYDEDFVALIDQMDWGKITELKKLNPNIMQPIRDVIAELYVDFVVQKRLAKKQQPPATPPATPPVMPPTPPPTTTIPEDWWEKVDIEQYGVKKARSYDMIGNLLKAKRLDWVKKVAYAELFWDIYQITPNNPNYDAAKQIMQTTDGMIIYKVSKKENFAKTELDDLFDFYDLRQNSKLTIPDWIEDIPFTEADRIVSEANKKMSMGEVINILLKVNTSTPPAAQGKFEWVTPPWEMLDKGVLNRLILAKSGNTSGNIRLCTFKADVPELNTGIMKKGTFVMIAIENLGDSPNMIEMYSKIQALSIIQTDRYLVNTYPEYEQALNEANAFPNSRVYTVTMDNFADVAIILAEPSIPAKPAKPAKPTKPSQPKPVKSKEIEMLDDLLDMDLDDF